MDIGTIKKIKDMACEKLQDVKRTDLDSQTGTEHIKNLMSIVYKAECIEADSGGGYSNADGYSMAGDWAARGTYGSPMSGENRGQHYVRGHYSRADGYGGYSRDDGRTAAMGYIEQAMSNARSESERSDMQRALEVLRRNG